MPSSRLYANSPIPTTIIKKERTGIFDVSILFDNDCKFFVSSSISFCLTVLISAKPYLHIRRRQWKKHFKNDINIGE